MKKVVACLVCLSIVVPLQLAVRSQSANAGNAVVRLDPKLDELIAEFARLARKHGFHLRVVAFPVRDQVEAPELFDYPQRRLREITRPLDIPLFDLLPLLRDEHTRSGATSPPMFFDNCHLTPRGSRIVARAVYEFLKDAPDAKRPGRG